MDWFSMMCSKTATMASSGDVDGIMPYKIVTEPDIVIARTAMVSNDILHIRNTARKEVSMTR
jgi:hypothetical protein